MKKIYFVDASPYIFRAYFSLPQSMTDQNGNPANAVFGFAGFLCQLLEQTEAEFIAVAFDRSLTTSFRNDFYSAYKAQRELPPPELEAQIDACLELAMAMGLPSFIDDRYEADDLIGTLIHRARPEDFSMVIVSGDKDLAQLVQKGDLLWDFARDRKLDVEGVIEHFGVAPHQIVDLLALMGDAVDNIPGIPGIGQKTAAALLKELDSLENIYARLASIPKMKIRGASRIYEALQTYRDQAFLSQRLARIAVDAPLPTTANALRRQPKNQTRLNALFDRLGFGTGIRERVKALK